MNQETKWLRENIKRVVNNLGLSITVQVVSDWNENVENSDIIYLTRFSLHLFKTTLFERLKDKKIIVTSNEVKDSLIEHGCKGKNIAVCSFWGPILTNYEIRPATVNTEFKILDNNKPWIVAISELQRSGGIGLVDNGDVWNIPKEFLLFLLAGVPLAAPSSSAVGKLIKEYNLGISYDSFEKVKEEHINYENYTQWANNSAKIGRMMVDESFIKQVLIDQTIHYQLEKNDVATHSPRFGISVMESLATLDYIAQHRCSVARLGDGEISLILGAPQVFQDENAELQKRLDEIVKQGSNEKLLVCLSDTFHDLDRYVPSAQKWWEGHLNTFENYYQELGDMQNLYGNTMVTRPYMDLQDRNRSSEIFRRIKLWWDKRDILIVEGKFTRSGVNNDLYDNATSVQRILCPPKNAWEKHEQIEKAIKKYGKEKLVLVMLGMTATVIAADLATWGQVIDLGHLDPEYEWYRMGATKRIPIQGKHTAEMNYDQGVPQNIDDPKYLSEIILDLS